MTSLRSIAHSLRITAVAGVAAIALVSCADEGDDGSAQNSEPIAAIPAPEGEQWIDTVAISEDGGYVLGNPEAPIKLLEYGSLTCPGCAGFAAEASAPLKSDYINSGRVSFEFRSFIIHGPTDLALTRLIGCGAPEAAHPLSDQIWANLSTFNAALQSKPEALQAALALPENQRFIAFAQEAGMLEFFAARGLAEDEAKACLADFAAMEALAKQTETYASDDDITSTPTFFINGGKVDGIRWQDVEAALQRAGAR